MRVAENLNAALHGLMERDATLHVLGEDIADPYGGAFKVTRGLSDRFPERVLSTPISENAITGVAAGLALAGDAAVVEMMFGDFTALAFDQLVNFAAKSVTMYGSTVPMRMVLRCPVGGGRGYGPTHSQSLQKHFVGVPGLALYEASPFRDQGAVLAEMLERGEPGVLFEDKVLYTRPMYEVPAPFVLSEPDAATAEISVPGERPDCVIVAGGGVAHRVLDAMRTLLVEEEVACTLLVPTRLWPFSADDLELPGTGAVFVVEEGTAGGTWGAEVAHALHARHWSRLDRPVTLVHSADSVIPTAAHLEREVLVSAERVHRTILETLRA